MDSEMRMFLELLYSLARQYCKWYEAHIKKGRPASNETPGAHSTPGSFDS